MVEHNIPHFQNDLGYKTISIGVKEFMCAGATPPFDHPHVFIDMGAADEKICPYCSTLYRYDPSLPYNQTDPKGCLYHPDDSL
ncbi:putative Zn-finger protein [Bartonella silvatica]|uniref:Zn-finger protein n=1 Tax=Bartonella silvatica TaxID=357760 RepID=A0ABV2HHE0_9HYPH